MFILFNDNKFSLAVNLLEDNSLFIKRAKKINDKVFLIEGTENKIKLHDRILIQDIEIKNQTLSIKNKNIDRNFNLIEV